MPDSKLISDILRYYAECDHNIIKTFEYCKDLPFDDRAFIFDLIDRQSGENLNDKTQYEEFIKVFLSDNYNSFQKLKYFLDNDIKISEKLKNDLIEFVVKSDIFKNKILKALETDYDVFYKNVDDNNKMILESLKSKLFNFDNLTYKQKYNLLIDMFFDERDVNFEKYSDNIYYSIDDLVDQAFEGGENDEYSYHLLNEKFSTFNFTEEKESSYDSTLNHISDRVYKFLSDNNIGYEAVNSNFENSENEVSFQYIKDSLSKYGSAIELIHGLKSYVEWADSNTNSSANFLCNDIENFIINYNDELKDNDKTKVGEIYKGSSGLRVNNYDLDSLINTDYRFRYTNIDEIDLSKCNVEVVLSELNNVLYDSFGFFGLKKIIGNDSLNFNTKKESYMYLYDKITEFGTIDSDSKYFNNIEKLVDKVPKVSEVVLYNRFINDLKEKVLNKENLNYADVSDIKKSLDNIGLQGVKKEINNKSLSL